ncbi:MAG: homoserine dehydrogenase [Sedimentibacter saalensis]|uniref:Homoserine dehydrogenase n=1 Tax=Sedimentibacter saalensis TaxID=130788 RepID=A0A562J846_9FIRM|nr:homoserine dehydrogenase [Sedimentibacter saalensis]MEA5093458.1 homoserine dehydrogenase [Sedimentibacter saalensis]TWH79346.1 homoserine dehydrogenase [Sedimentibacter saalensis]
MEKVGLGILGMGTVASGLINIIGINNSKITGSLNKELVINKVLVKSLDKKRDVNLPQEVYTTDAYDVINHKDTQIIVELIGGISPAYEYIKAALNNKKHVVTANKALIATHGEELEELAYKNGVSLMYEASVAGGIPIINTMTDNLCANEITDITGIINGTTNYILTQMAENNLEYEQAVKDAQALGFAEADPSSDVEGDDAAYKLSILSTIAFGQRINVRDIPKEGITKISKEDISYAKELGYNIKLLASASRKGDEIELRVHPAFVPASHPLSTVKNEYNAVFLKGNAVGGLMLYGKGAGSLPTGSAVLGDVMHIVKTGGKAKIDLKKENKYLIANKAHKQYYIRFEVIDKPGVLANIASIFGKNDISLASVVQRQKNGDETAPLVFITHEVDRKNIDAALEEIKDYKNVTQIASIIVVENFK